MEAVSILEKELDSRVVVRFQDCDPFGHLNNVRYIDYFMNAREDQLLDYYDFDLFGHTQNSGNGWVVSKNQIAYLYPARMKEEVLIRTRLIHRTERTLVVEGVMYDTDERHIKAVMWVEFTYINVKSGRPGSHEPELMALFDAVVIEDLYDGDTSFSARASELRSESRVRRRETAAA
jgi:acyl-CoA thioester hydrolase